jgi:hypothetical protein
MNRLSIPAHFDGERIRLDAPVELEANTRLLVTVLPSSDTERESWLLLSAKRLEDAYVLNEEEYPLNLIKEANAEYEGR